MDPGVFEQHAVDGNCYIVIVTRGHLHDQEVLEEALVTKAGYVGMIGSNRKRNLIRAALVEKGFSGAKIERVCTPIGLDIGAETPAEIALSIVAELVKARAGRYLPENYSTIRSGGKLGFNHRFGSA